MADADYVPGEGDVEIELEGGNQFLKPTLEACLRISRSGEDGPRRLADKVLALNFDAICHVVAAGLGKPVDEIQEVVFRTGTVNIFGACLRFIHIVSNGGRPPKKEEEKKRKGPPESS